MINAIALISFGYYDAWGVKLLAKVKNKVKLLIDAYRSIWNDTRYITMTDGWTNGKHRILINFLVYYPKGIAFIKSVDISAIMTYA